MIERVRALDGATELLTWISLANVAVAVGMMVAMALTKARPAMPWSMAFLAAIALVYTRSTYRNLTGTPITYAGALIHAGIAVVGLGMLVSVLRVTREAHSDG